MPAAVSGWCTVSTRLAPPCSGRAIAGTREAEVEQLHARLGEHEVGGLEVAMHEARAVRFGERARDLHGARQQRGELQRPALEARRERLALDQLHHEVVGAFVIPDVVKRADVRVVELRQRARLAFEARAQVVARRQPRGQHLDRDVAPGRDRARYTSPMPPAPRGAEIS